MVFHFLQQHLILGCKSTIWIHSDYSLFLLHLFISIGVFPRSTEVFITHGSVRISDVIVSDFIRDIFLIPPLLFKQLILHVTTSEYGVSCLCFVTLKFHLVLTCSTKISRFVILYPVLYATFSTV